MSSGVCGVCQGACPAFTGAPGEATQNTVVALHVVSVHGTDRHLVFCDACTRLLVGVWARTAKRGRRQAFVGPAPSSEIVACGTCGTVYTGNHTCPPEDEEGTE